MTHEGTVADAAAEAQTVADFADLYGTVEEASEGATYADLERDFDGMTYEEVDAAFAGKTYEDLENYEPKRSRTDG